MNPTLYSPRPLPKQLSGLAELALDLHWSWNHTADVIWQAIDPEMWETNQNPWSILASVPQRHLEELAADRHFCAELAEQLKRHRASLARPTWFEQTPQAKPGMIAMFSMEFALTEALPIYSGGLGIISGDWLKAASDLGIPAIGIGLLYQQGNFRQALDASCSQLEFMSVNDPAMLPVLPLEDDNGDWLRVSVELPGRSLKLRCWRAQVGRAQIYLLDSNDPENSAGDRGITRKLYGNALENRLQQEIVLGLGGWRMLKAMHVAAEICHLNEAHAAFAVLERARCFMEEGSMDFGPALQCTRAGNVFTCHTPVAAGFDHFPADLIARYLRGYATELGIDINELIALGRAPSADPTDPFNMAYLAVRGCGKLNALSGSHQIISRTLFEPLFRRWPAGESPVERVNVGVHLPSWESPTADEFWTILCGNDRWLLDEAVIGQAAEKAGDETLWAFRTVQRKLLIESLQRRLARQAAIHELDDPGSHLDPNTLTMVIAHNFTAHRRSHLLLFDPERLARLLRNPDMPVQLIVAGKAHPNDVEGKRIVRAWALYMHRLDVHGRMIFLEDYDLELAHDLAQGADLWINLPRISTEPSGTGGMKVLVNGGLNLGKQDGWWADAFTPEAGWMLKDGSLQDAGVDRDPIESLRLFDLLETEIIPAFYSRDPDGIPAAWVRRMRASMANLAHRYSSHRMLREYMERCYIPCMERYRERTASQGLVGREIFDWKRDLDNRWANNAFGAFKVQSAGGRHEFSIQVNLAGMQPDMISVQLYAEPRNGGDAFRQEMQPQAAPSQPDALREYRATVPAGRPIQDYTPRIIPRHHGLAIPLEENHSLWLR